MRILTKKQVIGMILRQLNSADRVSLTKTFTLLFDKRLDIVDYEKETFKIRKERI